MPGIGQTGCSSPSRGSVAVRGRPTRAVSTSAFQTLQLLEHYQQLQYLCFITCSLTPLPPLGRAMRHERTMRYERTHVRMPYTDSQYADSSTARRVQTECCCVRVSLVPLVNVNVGHRLFPASTCGRGPADASCRRWRWTAGCHAYAVWRSAYTCMA